MASGAQAQDNKGTAEGVTLRLAASALQNRVGRTSR